MGRREADARARAYEASGCCDNSFKEMLLRTRSSWIVGSVDEVAARLRRLREFGVKRVVVRHLNHDDGDMIHLLGCDLAPLLAS